MSPKKSSLKRESAKKNKHKQLIDNPSNKSLMLFFLIAVGIVLIIYCKSFDFIQDDSYITYRYVKNFTEGNGLVFNIGDRVEGYTCFLWVILLSFIKIIGFDFISASQTFGIIFSLLTLFFTYKISSVIFIKNKGIHYNIVFSLSSIILLVSNGAFAYWTVSGMETALFAFLTTCGIYLYLKEFSEGYKSFPYSSLIFLLGSLSRPEGNLIFAITFLHKIIILYSRHKIKKEELATSIKSKLFSRNNLIWISIYLIPAILFMIWRYSYYGFLFPNTFYAKTGTTLEYFKTGLDYFIDFAKSYGLYGILIVLVFINLKKGERFFEYLYLVLIFVLFSIYIIYIGGDVLRPARFFIPILPTFYILVQESAHNLISMYSKKQVSVSLVYSIAVIFIIISYYSYKEPYEQIKRYSELENGLVVKMKLTAQWLRNKSISSHKTLTVAATTIGAISYYSDVILIDMLGLTDREIAHNPKPIPEISSNTEIGWKERHYNIEYVLSKKPDYIYFSTGIKPSAYAERGLFTNEEFLKEYYPSYFTIKEQQFTDCIYKRKTEEEIRNTKTPQLNIKYQKTFVNIYNQAMNTSRDKTKVQEAINLYKQCLDIAPSNFGTPYGMIGDLYLQMKNKDKAIENYKKAVEIDDYNIMPHYYLYQFAMEKGDSATAEENLNKILKYSPDLIR